MIRFLSRGATYCGFQLCDRTDGGRRLPKGADCRRAQTAEGRRLPKGANCRRAQTAERRSLPNDAACRTTRPAERRSLPNDAACRTTQPAERRTTPHQASRSSTIRQPDRLRWSGSPEFPPQDDEERPRKAPTIRRGICTSPRRPKSVSANSPGTTSAMRTARADRDAAAPPEAAVLHDEAME